MATVTAGTTYPLLMNELSLANLWSGSVADVTRSRIKVAYDTFNYVEFGGAFLFDALGYLSGGQLTSITEVRDGATAWSATGFAVSVSTFLMWSENDMTEEAMTRILGTADRITGSTLDDVLKGYDGDDVMLGGAGDDVLMGDNGADDLQGGDGDDALAAGFGGGQVDGGAGDDILFHFEAYGSAQAVLFDFSALAPSSAAGVFLSDGRGAWFTARNVERVYVDGSEAADVVVGSQGGDFLSGWGGDDKVLGGLGDDLVYGDDGDDFVAGGAGVDFVDGGLGIDTAEIGGFRRHFEVDLATGSAQSDRAGTDTVSSIENMVFIDGTLTIDTHSYAAEVFRLYDATLGRGPDVEGLSYWVNTLATGAQSLTGLADSFVGSAEFVQSYGALNDEQFVNLLYQNVLGRGADAPGLAYWLQYMAGGASRAQVVLGFSESPENVDSTAGSVHAGLWVQDWTTAAIARLYDTALGRMPDTDGLAGMRAAAASGMSLLTMADAFVLSPEFQSAYGPLSDAEFVKQLYRNTLDREAEGAGVDYWTGYMAGGHSRAEVVLQFSESPEHRSLTAAHIDNGIWTF